MPFEHSLRPNNMILNFLAVSGLVVIAGTGGKLSVCLVPELGGAAVAAEMLLEVELVDDVWSAAGWD